LRTVLLILSMGSEINSAGNLHNCVKYLSDFVHRFNDALANPGFGDNTIRDCSSLSGLMDLINQELRSAINFIPDADTADLYKLISFLLDNAVIKSSGGIDGRVEVTNYYDLRGRNPKTVFVSGMNSGVFPSTDKTRKIPFYNQFIHIDPELRERFPSERLYQEDQMLLFYNLLESVNDSVCFSWVENDDSKRSIFMDELLQVVEAEEHYELSFDESPASHKLTNITDLTRLIVDSPGIQLLTDNEFKDKYPAISYDHFNIITSLADLGGIRETVDRFNEYQGNLSESSVRADIEKIYNDHYQHSPSSLEKYGKCPFMYFCDKVLGIEPVDEKTDEISFLTEGNYYHYFLREFYGRAKEDLAKEGQYSPLSISSYAENFDEIVDQVTEDILSREDLITTDFVRESMKNYRKNLKRFLHFDMLNMENTVPELFEFSFGRAGRDFSETDSRSVSDPYILNYKKRTISLNGIIDRVDIGYEHQNRLRVLDYKSGNIPNVKDLKKGIALQMYMYLLAASDLLSDIFPDVKEAAGLFSSVKKLERSKEIILRDNLLMVAGTDYMEILSEYLMVYTDRIKKGIFVPLPKGEQCNYCPYRAGCRVDKNPSRVSIDSLNLEVKNA